MMRKFRSNFSGLLSANRLSKSPILSSSVAPLQTVPMGSSILSSATNSSSSTSSSSMANKNEIGIERTTITATKSLPKTPRFFFWTLTQCEKKKNAGTSLDSSPRTPDSSRSVSFEDAENWPWIDDVEEAECCEC